MKITKDPYILGTVAWAAAFFIAGYYFSKFFLLPIALIPLAVYEFIRTEGKKNTKPLSLLIIIILTLQFLHAYKIYSFPFDLSFIISFSPIPIPTHIDQFIFLSTVALIICSLLLIKHTWGSVTKFIAILLLAGSILMGFTFWQEIQAMLKTPAGKELINDTTDNIKDNIQYRLESELQ